MDENISLHKMDQEFHFGGLIGFADSHFPFFQSVQTTCNAKLLDAAGAVYLHNGNEPGYCCMIGRCPNSCLLGHVTGLLYCLYLKLFVPSIFNLLDF